MYKNFDITADLDTPVSAWLKLNSFDPRFLLESVVGGERVGRYSFLGLGEALSVRLDGCYLQIGASRQPRPQTKTNLLNRLRHAVDACPRLLPDLPNVPFAGGLVGATAYDMVRFFEDLPGTTRNGELLASYVACSSVLVFDHLTRRIALLHDGDETDRQNFRKEIVRALRGGIPNGNVQASIEEPRFNIARPAFESAVDEVKGFIQTGDVYQLVLSIAASGQTDVDPFQVYRALRLINPSPYMYFCKLDGITIVGSSPEALVTKHGNRASLRPIAGTRPRGTDDDDDRRMEAALLADPKEAAEHVMLVDLARNDLGRVARPGSIVVDPYRSVERYSHVMHLVSGVSGELDEGVDAFDLFAAAFPAGTLVGAPKIRAMELIDTFEPERRGFYAGTVGHFASNGDMDQAIAIRTLMFENDQYRFQAGAGIVADSIPDREYHEVMAKGAVLRRALAMAGEGL